jgi:hypothetical protein
MTNHIADLLGALRNRVEGRKVVSAEDGVLTLDDGTILKVYESESDCCASANGTWWILNPNNLDAIITDVQYLDGGTRDNYDGNISTATVVILHNQNPIAQADCYADDGNGGYYYWVCSMDVFVPRIEAAVLTMEVVSC